MIYPDRREGNLPIIVDLFPLGNFSCDRAIRDFDENGNIKEEDRTFRKENELLYMVSALNGIIRYGESPVLDYYTSGMLIYHRAHRAEALSFGGRPATFHFPDIIALNNSYSKVANLIHNCINFNMSQLPSPLSPIESVWATREKLPNTYEQFLGDLMSHHAKSKVAFRKREKVFDLLLLARSGNSYDAYQDAMLNGIVDVWAAFKFLSQKPAA